MALAGGDPPPGMRSFKDLPEGLCWQKGFERVRLQVEFQGLSQTQYSTVIVTRNRPEALALSLPLMLEQSRLPQDILVVDSSDDPAPNKALVDRLAAQTAVPLRHMTSPAGMTVQRNIGLAQVSSEVVFFPDDDSLVLPGTLEAMMRIYDLDTQGIVGGVCSAEAKAPPQGVLNGPGAGYQMTTADRLKAKIARMRFAFEERFFRDPFFLVAERKYARMPGAPSWMAAENAILVPWMTGFRMSYRTELVRRTGFNEHLGRYALFEDTDACFGILRDHLLVGARNAQIYHHKAPARRANGRAMGAMQILNRAYVLARAQESDARMLAMMRRFSGYKIAQYALGARGSFGRDRLAGARAAHDLMPALFSAPPEDLTPLYLKLRAACFEGEN